MPRIDLQVPFQEKDEAKRLGAKWDGEKRVWYAPDGMDTAPLKKWIPETAAVNIRAGFYYIAETRDICWKCNQVTRVFGWLLPPGHETPVEGIEEDDAESGTEHSEWTANDYPVFIYFVSHLTVPAQAHMKKLTQQYRLDHSKTADGTYWMNHCEHCGAKIGDFALYTPPDVAFCPIDSRAAALITLHRIDQPLEAHCGALAIGPFAADDEGDTEWDRVQRSTAVARSAHELLRRKND